MVPLDFHPSFALRKGADLEVTPMFPRATAAGRRSTRAESPVEVQVLSVLGEADVRMIPLSLDLRRRTPSAQQVIDDTLVQMLGTRASPKQLWLESALAYVAEEDAERGLQRVTNIDLPSSAADERSAGVWHAPSSWRREGAPRKPIKRCSRRTRTARTRLRARRSRGGRRERNKNPKPRGGEACLIGWYPCDVHLPNQTSRMTGAANWHYPPPSGQWSVFPRRSPRSAVPKQSAPRRLLPTAYHSGAGLPIPGCWPRCVTQHRRREPLGATGSRNSLPKRTSRRKQSRRCRPQLQHTPTRRYSTIWRGCWRPPRIVTADETHPELWVHEPVLPAPAQEKCPLVLIAPAGSNLLTGAHLSAGDRREHLPWVREGYLVVAYELRGAATDSDELGEAMTTFWHTMAGVTEGMAAPQWALSNLAVDEGQVVAAGHSAATTHALMFAAVEPKVSHVASVSSQEIDFESVEDFDDDGRIDLVLGGRISVGEDCDAGFETAYAVGAHLAHAQPDGNYSSVELARTTCCERGTPGWQRRWTCREASLECVFR